MSQHVAVGRAPPAYRHWQGELGIDLSNTRYMARCTKSYGRYSKAKQEACLVLTGFVRLLPQPTVPLIATDQTTSMHDCLSRDDTGVLIERKKQGIKAGYTDLYSCVARAWRCCVTKDTSSMIDIAASSAA